MAKNRSIEGPRYNPAGTLERLSDVRPGSQVEIHYRLYPKGLIYSRNRVTVGERKLTTQTGNPMVEVRDGHKFRRLGAGTAVKVVREAPIKRIKNESGRKN